MAANDSARAPSLTAGVIPEMWKATAPARIAGQSKAPGWTFAIAEAARS